MRAVSSPTLLLHPLTYPTVISFRKGGVYMIEPSFALRVSVRVRLSEGMKQSFGGNGHPLNSVHRNYHRGKLVGMVVLHRIARRAVSMIPGGPAGSVLGIHVFHCPDAVGIVAKLSECIASRGGNIHSVDVFVPEKKQVFYSRRWQEGRLPVDISCVISNHQRAPNTHVALFLERHGIPYHHLPTSAENTREAEILELVEDTDFLVLARYMQVLSRRFLESYGKDIINIHHGLLPSFKGGNPSKQVERVSHRDTLKSFAQKSENLEKQCLTQVIKSYCELRVLPYQVSSNDIRHKDKRWLLNCVSQEVKWTSCFLHLTQSMEEREKDRKEEDRKRDHPPMRSLALTAVINSSDDLLSSSSSSQSSRQFCRDYSFVLSLAEGQAKRGANGEVSVRTVEKNQTVSFSCFRFWT
ncbi:hypothetical protein MUK42_33326 [Musa troglodytarum]|uniref:Formyl transferase N-terminal domain-containing protein n=1 Tax=Musa troglodytarum TaxID=320322 RepID=A0A9E7JLB4_9LILI|nr:hypothetical protein MUK42_33326 [Musa troglodytarum]